MSTPTNDTDYAAVMHQIRVFVWGSADAADPAYPDSRAIDKLWARAKAGDSAAKRLEAALDATL